MTEQDHFDAAITKMIVELKRERGDTLRYIEESTGITKSTFSHKVNAGSSWTTVELGRLAQHWGFENGFQFVLSAEKYDDSVHGSDKKAVEESDEDSSDLVR